MKKDNVGIYKIICKSNRGFYYIYIGQSKNLSTRWRKHFGRLIDQDHYNDKIQKLFNKYGIEGFNFEIIENCLIHELDEREIYYIKSFDSYKTDHGLNLTSGGRAACLQKSDTLKISAVRGENHMWYGKQWTDEEKDTTRQRFLQSVNFINPNGELINVIGISKFCIDNKLDQKTIKRLRCGEILEYKGYRLPVDEYNSLSNKSDIILNPKERTQTWSLITPEGKIIYIFNIFAFCKKMGFFSGSFSSLKSGRYKSYKGYRYYNPPTLDNPWDADDFTERPGLEDVYVRENRFSKSVSIVDPEGTIIHINGVDSLCEKMGFGKESFRALRMGKRSEYKGYRLAENVK